MVAMDERQQRTRAFAAELHQLRVSAGTPSFRKMASLSGCISHTTLAEAEKGLRFPSWETTREFVKACQGDEADWQERWNRTKEAITPREPVLTPPQSGVERKRYPRIPLVRAAAVLLVLLGICALIVMIAMTPWRDSSGDAQAPRDGPLIEGDQSSFIRDVTIPDETPVQVGKKFVKVWEFRNSGSVTWGGRYLQRQDRPASPDTCQTPDKVPIGDTLPNEHVLISVEVTAPSKPTTCKIYWKMVDSQGQEFFPKSRRPVFFWVHIVN